MKFSQFFSAIMIIILTISTTVFAQTISKYNQHKPDLVILGVVLPVFDGFETLIKIRNMDNQAKIIMISVSGDENTIHDCIEKGAIGFITKPFTKEEFLSNYKNLFYARSELKVVQVLIQISGKFEDVMNKFLNSKTSVILKNYEIFQKEDSQD